jgi:hypothetical protein
MAQAIIRELVRIGTLDDVGTAPMVAAMSIPAHGRTGKQLAEKPTSRAATFVSGNP